MEESIVRFVRVWKPDLSVAEIVEREETSKLDCKPLYGLFVKLPKEGIDLYVVDGNTVYDYVIADNIDDFVDPPEIKDAGGKFHVYYMCNGTSRDDFSVAETEGNVIRSVSGCGNNAKILNYLDVERFTIDALTHSISRTIISPDLDREVFGPMFEGAHTLYSSPAARYHTDFYTEFVFTVVCFS